MSRRRGDGGPRFSVVVPTWNRAAVLRRAAASVLAQSFDDLELIVVDDGSGDDTAEVVASLGDPRLRYVRQDHQGVCLARNRGAELARGELLAFLDSDDEALPGWLAAFAGAFDAGGVGLVSCGMWQQEAGSRHAVLPERHGAEQAHDTSLVQAGTFAVPRELFLRAGGYWRRLTYSENTDLGLRLSRLCADEGLAVVPIFEPLIVYHCEASRPVTAAFLRHRLTSAEHFLARHGDTLAQNPESLASHLSAAGYTAARLDDLPAARAFFWRAVKATPVAPKRWLRWLVSLVPPATHRLWPPLRDGDEESP